MPQDDVTDLGKDESNTIDNKFQRALGTHPIQEVAKNIINTMGQYPGSDWMLRPEESLEMNIVYHIREGIHSEWAGPYPLDVPGILVEELTSQLYNGAEKDKVDHPVVQEVARMLRHRENDNL